MRALGWAGREPCGAGCRLRLAARPGCVGVRDRYLPLPPLLLLEEGWSLHQGSCWRPWDGRGTVLLGLWETCFRADPPVCLWGHVAAGQVGWVGSSFPIRHDFPKPHFYSAQYLLVVSCATEGSPSSLAKAPWSPSRCAVGEAPRTGQGLHHCESSSIGLHGGK